jgi:YesN/AraC family two-component response regulator
MGSLQENAQDQKKRDIDANGWEADDNDTPQLGYSFNGTPIDISYSDIRMFDFQIPKYCTLASPSNIYQRFRNLIELDPFPQSSARLKQQHEFQGILEDLMVQGHNSSYSPAARAVAEEAALFIRKNYAQPLAYQDLSNSLKFHPTYIARCMQQVYGCTPSEYLTQYRLEQSKFMLMWTDHSIEKISELIGFSRASYFTRCFTKMEGVSPRVFRKNFKQ